MLWIITKDRINTNPAQCPSRVGWLVTGSKERDRQYAAAKKAKDEARIAALTKNWILLCDYQIRLYDDDDELYYEGVCKGLERVEEDQAFEPLRWAEGDAGCTKMTYRKRGTSEWKTL